MFGYFFFYIVTRDFGYLQVSQQRRSAGGKENIQVHMKQNHYSFFIFLYLVSCCTTWVKMTFTIMIGTIMFLLAISSYKIMSLSDDEF